MRDWERLGAISPEALKAVRLDLHWAMQLLAAFGQEYADPLPDDGHRAATWDGGRWEFVSAEAAHRPGLRVALDPVGFQLMVLDGDRATASTELSGWTLPEVGLWLADRIAQLEAGPGRSTLTFPDWDLPPHAVAEGIPFAARAGAECRELTRWYRNAGLALDAVVSTEAHTTPIRCWPHHLDIATLILLDPELGAEEGRSIGVGMSPGDASDPEPYWYVNPYPSPDPARLPSTPVGGRWHTEGWVGAVLPARGLIASGDAAEQAEALHEFLYEARSAARALLEES